MIDVTLERGRPEQKAALEHLIQFYVHDFSDFLAPEKRIHLREDGRFPDFPGLNAYWTPKLRSCRTRIYARRDS